MPTSGLVDSLPMAQQLRTAMGEFATGVTVVTSLGGDGVPRGSTANAVTSLSLEPPLLTVFFQGNSSTLGAIQESGRFAVNILAAHQHPLASAFAVKDDPTAWEGCELVEGSDDPPVLRDCVAWLVCDLHQCLPGGDHEIVVGRPTATGSGPSDHQPLIFHRGAFR